MKNLSLVLNIILLLAVGYLMIQHFQGPKANETAEPESVSESGNANIVYVNEDSLLNQYLYFVEKRDELTERERQGTVSLQQKAQKLEQEVRSIQARMQQGQLAPKQIASEEQRIGQQQQQLAQERDQISQELLLETQKLNQELQGDVKEMLETLKAQNGYDFVLSYGSGSGVLMVNDQLDITAQLVTLLNAKRPPSAQ